jgi:hypothetical protein
MTPTRSLREGLTSAQAKTRLLEFGPNEMPPEKSQSILATLWKISA